MTLIERLLLDVADAAYGVLPEVIDADFPSVLITSDFSASTERLKGIGDRWAVLRAALAEFPWWVA